MGVITQVVLRPPMRSARYLRPVHSFPVDELTLGLQFPPDVADVVVSVSCHLMLPFGTWILEVDPYLRLGGITHSNGMQNSKIGGPDK